MNGNDLAKRGMKKAQAHADAENEGWSEDAYAFFVKYAKKHKEFMTEDVRNASKGVLPDPPDTRAWGPIAVRAVREGIIERKCFQAVK